MTTYRRKDGHLTMDLHELADVAHSAGTVFNGLTASRLDTETFFRTGHLDGFTSYADLALLEDLRDAAQFITGHPTPMIDADFVAAVNAQFTRSGALHPGQLRTADQNIGVATRYGRHTPDAVTPAQLQHLLEDATANADVCENALTLFLDLAKAQPFEDANKRTALFVANSALIHSDAGVLLVIPVDDHDLFNDLLAKAYLHGDDTGVRDLLLGRGLV